jgi:hypothetical protein
MDENKVHAIPGHENEYNGKEKQLSVRSIISDYGERTTFHGLRYLILGGSFIRQLIWFGFISSSLVYSTFNGVKLFTNFFSYPTMTKNEIITYQRMLFPAITVCNYNLLRKSKQQELNTFVKSAFSSEEGNSNLKNERDVDIDKMYHMFGHRMDEDGMFVSCKWRGKSCSGKDFRSSAQSMGLCHTFNSGKNYVITRHVLTSCGI